MAQQAHDATAPVHPQAVEHAQPARTQTPRVQGALGQRYVSVLAKVTNLAISVKFGIKNLRC